MNLTFECETDEEREAASSFLTWLCESGEQDYWRWQENVEYDIEGNITIVRFDYNAMMSMAKCTLGRVTKPE